MLNFEHLVSDRATPGRTLETSRLQFSTTSWAEILVVFSDLGSCFQMKLSRELFLAVYCVTVCPFSPR